MLLQDDECDSLQRGGGTDNQLRRKRASDSSTTSRDTIAHSGISNLTDWIKENVLDDLKGTLDDPQGNWQQLHRVLAKYNLEIAERGNGLIIRDKTRKLFIKASVIDRDLSKAKLIHRYGKIEPCDATDIKPTLSFGQERTDFWDKYQEEMKANKETKKLKLDNLKEHQSKEIDSIKQKWSKKREQLKQSNLLSGRFKKQMYTEYYAKQRAELQEVYGKNKTDRQQVYTQHKQKTYKEWLITKASAGDAKALATLRRKLPKPLATENTLGGKINHWIYTTKKPLITKQGYVVYRVSSGKIIDKGNHLKVTEIDDEALVEALKMASLKYGKSLQITGDDAFKERVATLVHQHKLDIGFKDRAMKQLLSDTRAKERERSKVNKGNSLTF